MATKKKNLPDYLEVGGFVFKNQNVKGLSDYAPIKNGHVVSGSTSLGPVRSDYMSQDSTAFDSDVESLLGDMYEFSKNAENKVAYKSYNKAKSKLKTMGYDDEGISSLLEKYRKQREEREGKYFKKSQGNWAQTILGSSTDALENASAGVIGMGETAVDTLAYLSPGAVLADDVLAGRMIDWEKQRQVQEGAQKFIQKDLYDEKAVAKKLVTENVEKNWGINVEDNSIFAEKSDALFQSAGQLGATAALSAAGVPWWLVTGTTSFGSEVENALNQGATYGQAGASGLITAGAEVLSEKLSGGIKFGGKTLDDALVKTLANRISDKTIRTLAKVGMDMAGEGAEEVISSVISRLGSSLYKEENIEELLTNEEAFDEYIDSFVGGAVLGGTSSVIGATKSAVKGKDFVTGNTKNEQAVVDKVTENRIAEQETGDKKLSSKEKAAIKEQVQRDLEKGYIDIDTIESVLGGDDYNAYKSALDQEEAMQKEFVTLNRMKQGEMTGEQLDRRAELKEQLAKFHESTNTKQMKEKLSQTVNELTQKDMLLRESYNEKSRRGQSFEADLTKYDTKQQEVIQKAANSGILNNTNKTHDFVDMIAKISADKGVSFDFTNNEKLKESGFAVEGKNVNGFVKDGNITLNIQSTKALNKVVGHEITHVLEGTELYSELSKVVKDYAETKGEFQSRLADIEKLYKNVEGANVENELVADLVGDYLFTDENFVKNLSSGNRNIFQKIYDEIKYLCKVVSAGSKEARELEKVKRTFEKAYRETSKNDSRKETKYHVSETFSEEIDKTLNGTMDKSSLVKAREYTPKILVDYGISDLPMMITQNHIKSIIYNQEEAKKLGLKINNKIHYHGLGKDLLVKAVDSLDNPMEIYKKSESEYIIVTTLKDSNGSTIIAPIRIDGKGSYNNVYLDENHILSVYGKDNLNYYLKKNNFDKIYDKKRTTLNERDEFPNISDSSKNIIPQEAENTTKSYSIGENNNIGVSKGDVYGEDVVLEKNSTETQETLDDMGPVREEMFSAADETEEVQSEISEKNALKIKNIKAKIEGFKVTKDVTSQEFAERIAEKKAEYDELQRKDTKKAVNLRNQITNLESRRDSILGDMDRRIKGHYKAIDNIENQSRFEHRKTKQKEIRDKMSELIGDTSTWQDKNVGLQYQTNTLRRNLRDIVRDSSGNRDIERADAIYDELQGKYNHNEALLNKEANEIKQKYKDLKLTKAEDVYVQMLGEYKHNPNHKITPDEIKEFYEKNKKNIDVQKVEQVIDSARKLYDSLYRRVNEVLSEHGFKEIGYHEGYFPHFTEEKQKWYEKLLNWKTQKQDIPTDIAGLTEEFNPQRSWQSFDKHRTGESTDYSFSKGLDTYVKGALDWIYHIEDIQKRRALETEIRYRHSDKGVQEKIDQIRSNPLKSAEEVESEIEEILKEAKNPLGNFLTDFRNATNNLAGKKSTADRSMEYLTNRQIYSTMTNISNRVTGNMVAGSVSSALTNFIPITQSWGQVSPVSSLKAMKETIKSMMMDDGTIAKSDFLTNRLNAAENLYKSGWDKAGEVVGKLMEVVDNFTSQTVWRSKYMENIQNGMSESQAIKDADQFSENVMAGRSRGNMPTIYNSKNPVTKVFTAFQLEVANQYGYMFKDMPQDVKGNRIEKLAKGYATMFVGAYAYNALYSSLTGRDAAFDPIGIIEEFMRDLMDEEEEEAPLKALGGLGSNIVEEIPYLGGLMGGGRIPIASAIPYDDPLSMVTGTAQDIADGDWANLKNEWSNPLWYLAMPMGGGQLRKTKQGRAMFDDDLPVSGSYTASGQLRFPVEDTFLNKLQAGVFGQYASANAREYFDRELAPLKEKQIQEYKELDLPISDYWDYREGLKKQETLEDKFEYIADLDVSVEQKNIMINNIVDRKEKVDMENYDDFANYEEFDWYTRNTDKYNFLQENGISYADYKANDDIKEQYDSDYNVYKNNPEKVTMSKAITGNFIEYRNYMRDLDEIRADKDSKGNAISGSAKSKKIDYINKLDLDYGQKIIIYRMLYSSKTDKAAYNGEIIEYLNAKDDISYEDKITILSELDIKVDAEGNVSW